MFYKLNKEYSKELLGLFESIPTPSLKDEIDYISYEDNSKAWVVHQKNIKITATKNYFSYKSSNSFSDKSFKVKAFVNEDNIVNFLIVKVVMDICVDKDYSLSMNETDIKNLLKDILNKVINSYKNKPDTFTEESLKTSLFLRKKLRLL